jgi:hypothetical protein
MFEDAVANRPMLTIVSVTVGHLMLMSGTWFCMQRRL